MKRQRVSPDCDDNIVEGMPKDVYNELVTFIKPKMKITLELESEETESDQLFREYRIEIGICDLFSFELHFAVEIHLEKDNVYDPDVVFMYGDDNSDEFCYDTVSEYSFEDIKQLLKQSFEESKQFPPFIDIHDEHIVLDLDYMESEFQISRFNEKDLHRFKNRFDDLYRWVISSQLINE